MKNLVIIIICLMIYPIGYSQIMVNIDEISPYNEGVAAIKKGDKWGFIDENGMKVIDFRDDLVCCKNALSNSDTSYPEFNDDRCLINRTIDGNDLFGFIDKNGNEIIKPQYINATNFVNGYAIVIIIEKEIVGRNKVLGKDVVSYTLKDFIIDSSGKKIKQLDNARNYIKSKKNLPPIFYSKFIAPHLVAVQTTDEKKWNIYKF